MEILTNFYVLLAVVTIVSTSLFLLRRKYMGKPLNKGAEIIDLIIGCIILNSLVIGLYVVLPKEMMIMILLLISAFLLNGIVVNLRLEDSLKIIGVVFGAFFGLLPYGSKRLEKMVEGAEASRKLVKLLTEDAMDKKDTTEKNEDTTNNNNEPQELQELRDQQQKEEPEQPESSRDEQPHP